jgi:hypothetical protein
MILLVNCTGSGQKKSYWYEATTNDLKFIEDTLIKNAAFAANRQDTQAQHWLKIGRHKANKKALKVKDRAGYIAVLNYYLDGFAIDHLSVTMLEEAPSGHKKIERSKVAVVKFLDKGVWISIPSFNPDEQQRKIFTQIFQNLKKYRKAPFIIFDLRGNGGGDTNWERPILRNLYGDTFIKSLGKNHSYNELWVKKIRLSSDNLQNLKTIMPKSEFSLFKAAFDKGDTFFTKTWDIFNETKNLYSNKDIVQEPAKVYLLTDKKCGSTCWLFVREMRQMPKVEQIGEMTQAQSLYSQARFVTLPSNLAKLYFPMQQRVSPTEHINKPFIPKYKYNGIPENEDELKEWVRGIVYGTL